MHQIEWKNYCSMDLSSLIMGLFMIDFEKMSIEKQKKVEHLVKEI